MRKMKKVFSFRLCILLSIVMVMGNVIPSMAAPVQGTVKGQSIRKMVVASGGAIEVQPTTEAAPAGEPTAVPTVEPTVAPTATPTVAPTVAPKPTATPLVKENDYRVRYYVLNAGLNQPEEVKDHDKKNYSAGLWGSLVELKVVGNDADVEANLKTIPDYSAILKEDEYINWYVIKWYRADGWHVDGVIMKKAVPTATPTVAPPTETPTVEPTPTVAPPTTSPTVAPPTTSPTIAPPTTSPTVAPPTTTPTVTPTSTPIIYIVTPPTIPAGPVATATPVPTTAPTVSPTATPEQVIVVDNDTPQAPGGGSVTNDDLKDGKTIDIIDNSTPRAAGNLPKTGTTPIEVYYILGFALIVCGTTMLVSRRNQRKTE